MAESSHSSIPEPDNKDVVEYMREKTRLLVSPPPAGPHDEMPASNEVAGYFDNL